MEELTPMSWLREIYANAKGDVDLFFKQTAVLKNLWKWEKRVIRCKAAVAYGPGEPLVIEEVEVEPPQASEIRVKVLVTSLCDMDVFYWRSKSEMHRKLFPRIFGHEAIGIVESVGHLVTEFKKGDHVLTLIFAGQCGNCDLCTSGDTNMCEDLMSWPSIGGMNKSDNQTRFSVNGKPIHHFLAVSSLSEYTVLNSSCAVKINQAVYLDEMCLLSCPIATGIGAAWHAANIKEGSTVVIFGLGPVGLSVAQGARLRRAATIIGVDIDPEKEEIAMRFGVTEFLNRHQYTDTIHKVICQKTGGGADYAFECVGGDARVVTEALLSCHPVRPRHL